MPAYPTDYAPFSTPGGHTFIDRVGATPGTSLDAAHINPLRDDVVAYIQHHILGDLSNNQHSSGQIYELAQQTNFENLAYAATAATEYTQFQINSMLRLLMRYIIGGTANGATLSAMITTWLARSDASSVNLFSLANLIAGATDIDTLGAIVLRNATTGLVNLRALALSIPLGNANPAALVFRRVSGQTLPYMVMLDEFGATQVSWGAAGGLSLPNLALIGVAGTPLQVTGAASPTGDVAYVRDSSLTKHWRVTKDYWVVAKDGLYVGVEGAEKQAIDTNGNPTALGGGYVTATGTTMVLTATPFGMVNSAGVFIPSAGGTTTLTAPPGGGTSWQVAIYADDSGGIQHVNGTAAASSPPAPTLPEYASLLAMTTVANGQTTITQAQVTDRRFAPLRYVNPFSQLSPVGFGVAAPTNAIVSVGGTLISAAAANGLFEIATLQPASGQNAFGINQAITVDTTQGAPGIVAGARLLGPQKTGANALPTATTLLLSVPTAATLNRMAQFDASGVTNGQVSVWDKSGHMQLSSAAPPAASGLLANVTSVTPVGNDQSLVLTVVTSGAIATTSTVCTVTFAAPFEVAPTRVVLIPADSATWALAGTAQLTAASWTATNFLVKSGSTAPAAGTYTYTVLVI